MALFASYASDHLTDYSSDAYKTPKPQDVLNTFARGPELAARNLCLEI